MTTIKLLKFPVVWELIQHIYEANAWLMAELRLKKHNLQPI